MDQIISAIIIAAGGGILGIAARHFLDNPVREIAFNLPWFKVKAASLAGYWFGEYRFHDCGKKNEPTSVTGLYELIEWPGNIVLIREMPTTGEPATTVIRAKKRNGYLTGSYENSPDHDILHGVFQLWIHPRGKEMRGRFLGFSADVPNEFNVGEWLWLRLSTTRKKDDALEKAKSEFTERLRQSKNAPNPPLNRTRADNTRAG